MASCEGVNITVNPKTKLKDSADEEAHSSTTSVLECAICLQSCVHPVRLPCAHVFCFLCVKGASWQSKRCALCRQEIPEDFLEQPVLLSPEELKAAAGGLSGAESHNDHAWYYEGRNGWWQYDARTSRELEEAFTKGRKSTEMLIAGFLYVADLENMVQYRRNEHGRRRKIKRDVLNIPKKGVAGLRIEPNHNATPPTTIERVSSADGFNTAPHSHFISGILPSFPPIRPQTILGSHLTSPTLNSASSLHQSFSQLTISQQQVEDAEEEAEPPENDIPSGSSGDEEDCDRERVGSTAQQRRGHCPLRESQPTRIPPRGAPPSSVTLSCSRSPDGAVQRD